MFKTINAFTATILLATPMFSHTTINYAGCPSGTNPCSGFLVDCLDGCAFNSNSTLDFSWSRTIMYTDQQKVNYADVLAQKDCMSANAVQQAISTGLSQIATSTSNKIPCSITGNTWRYTYAQFEIDNLGIDECPYVSAQLKSLAANCQDWKAAALKSAQIAGIVVGVVAGVAGLVAAGCCIAKRCSQRQKTNEIHTP